MTPLRQRFVEDLQVRNYSPRTVQCYVHHVASFAKHFGKSPEKMGPEEIHQYQVYLVNEKKASWCSFNQAVCALRFLYRTTLPRSWPVSMIPYGKRPKRLPTVLGPDEVQKLLACAKHLKHRMVLTTLYAAGLRLLEGTHLRPTDIDSSRMLLRVECGKGAKERVVPLSPRLLTELREYWRTYRPSTWLFSATKPEQPINSSTIQRACTLAARAAGLKKRVTPHVLRHSYATGLLEAGVDLLTIQRLLGHRSFSSTLIYLHVRSSHLESIASPLDLLPLAQCPRIVTPEAPEPGPQAEAK
jgi:integrase/recombinase XerD